MPYFLKLFIFLGLLSHNTSLAVLGQDIGCFVPGECLNSNSIGVGQLDAPDQCLDFCKDTPNCLEFTHYQDDSACVLFSDCVELSDANCADCVSGDVTCESLVCNEPGT